MVAEQAKQMGTELSASSIAEDERGGVMVALETSQSRVNRDITMDTFAPKAPSYMCASSMTTYLRRDKSRLYIPFVFHPGKMAA